MLRFFLCHLNTFVAMLSFFPVLCLHLCPVLLQNLAQLKRVEIYLSVGIVLWIVMFP